MSQLHGSIDTSLAYEMNSPHVKVKISNDREFFVRHAITANERMSSFVLPSVALQIHCPSRCLLNSLTFLTRQRRFAQLLLNFLDPLLCLSILILLKVSLFQLEVLHNAWDIR